MKVITLICGIVWQRKQGNNCAGFKSIYNAHMSVPAWPLKGNEQFLDKICIIILILQEENIGHKERQQTV